MRGIPHCSVLGLAPFIIFVSDSGLNEPSTSLWMTSKHVRSRERNAMQRDRDRLEMCPCKPHEVQ